MIYVETSYYGVSFLCQYIPYILVVPVHRRGCQSISWWCLCIVEGARAYPGGVCAYPGGACTYPGGACTYPGGACAYPGGVCA